MHKLFKRCPDCKGEIFSDEQNGEEVCVNCGLVINDFVLADDYIPFEEENQQYPSHHLALGRNLGTEMNSRDLWGILRKRSSDDIPFRFSMMRNMFLDNRHTNLTKMLVQGSHLCETYGLGSNIVFSNYYGSQIRKVSKFIQKKSCCIAIARALFIITWSQTYQNEDKSRQMMLELGVTTPFLEQVSDYISKK